mmetsp:Transcript_50365/g.119747  ORF Transcript_50365/g.119747 Transcript_50365/m.119747 type:complete len:214 (-) Transcript_50365:37-678(-)
MQRSAKKPSHAINEVDEHRKPNPTESIRVLPEGRMQHKSYVHEEKQLMRDGEGVEAVEACCHPWETRSKAQGSAGPVECKRQCKAEAGTHEDASYRDAPAPKLSHRGLVLMCSFIWKSFHPQMVSTFICPADIVHTMSSHMNQGGHRSNNTTNAMHGYPVIKGQDEVEMGLAKKGHKPTAHREEHKGKDKANDLRRAFRQWQGRSQELPQRTS